MSINTTFFEFSRCFRPTSKILKSSKYRKYPNKRRVAIKRWVSYKPRAPNRRRVTGGYDGMYVNLLT